MEHEKKYLLEQLLRHFTERPNLTPAEAKEYINDFIDKNYPSNNITLSIDLEAIWL